LQAKILYGAPTPAPNPRRVRLEPAGGNFVASATYTMADIRLVSTVDFAAWIGLEMLVALAHPAAWHAPMSARGRSTA